MSQFNRLAAISGAYATALAALSARVQSTPDNRAFRVEFSNGFPIIGYAAAPDAPEAKATEMRDRAELLASKINVALDGVRTLLEAEAMGALDEARSDAASTDQG